MKSFEEELLCGFCDFMSVKIFNMEYSIKSVCAVQDNTNVKVFTYFIIILHNHKTCKFAYVYGMCFICKFNYF